MKLKQTETCGEQGQTSGDGSTLLTTGISEGWKIKPLQIIIPNEALLG